MTIKLHCFGESGNAYKAALALELSGLDWEPVFIDFFGGETRGTDFRHINVMGEVPVLVDGDVTLTQSGIMQMYVTEKTGKYGGGTPQEAREVMRWMFWDDHKLGIRVGMPRFLMYCLPEAKRPEGVVPVMEGGLKAAYATLNAHLGGRDWIV